MLEASGGRPRSGRATICSAVSSGVPMRLVNQLESGTSSIVLMFCARDAGRLVAGGDEQVVRQVVEAGPIVLRLCRRGVLRLRARGDRIVGVEPRPFVEIADGEHGQARRPAAAMNSVRRGVPP